MAVNSEVTTRKRGKGKPFTKGDPRINREGRRKIPDDLRVAMIGLWPHAVKTLYDLMRGDDPALRFKAAEVVLNRVMGSKSSMCDVGLITYLTPFFYDDTDENKVNTLIKGQQAANHAIDEIDAQAMEQEALNAKWEVDIPMIGDDDIPSIAD